MAIILQAKVPVGRIENTVFNGLEKLHDHGELCEAM
jgi:hypothetical protein